LLLVPLVWAALTVLDTLQKGNVQLVVIALSMLGMVLFQRGRPAAGGLLLAFATVSKLYPGLLVLYLLVRREWRAALWTAGWGVVLTLLTAVVTGTGTFVAFLGHLPGLLGGEAFPAFRNPAATAINYSVPGIVFKLKLFGVPGMNFAASHALGWAYTLVVVALVVAAGRRPVSDRLGPQVWLAILILGTLRSPFLPQAYADFPPLWLVAVLAAVPVTTSRTLGWALLAWCALNMHVPMDGGFGPRTLAVLTTVPQVATMLIAWLALQQAKAAAVAAPAGGSVTAR
jgi:hypothetical protein